MGSSYHIRKIGSVMVLERISTPRIRIFICWDHLIPEIVRIYPLETCNAEDMSEVIKEVNYYIDHMSECM
jgi:hypothetical protein